MKNKKISIVLISIILLSILATTMIYDKLPDQIPSHWNIKGEVDDFQSKTFVYFTATLPLLMYALMKILPKLDPKRRSYAKHGKAYEIFIVVMTLFIILIHWLTVAYALGYNIEISSVIQISLGVVFSTFGNYMSQIRHNYSFGIKTPWTLASETVWKKTHRLGGYVFFLIGILFIIGGFVGSEISYYITIGPLILSTIGLSVYSYIIYRKENPE
ncbi:putative membrane protein [Gottschalkia acidurici 9a]|uniref:Membrane protein n=1 Tax=Gottschalkia acidurici (strain ATCC 7906 / DSM 604 / BCRC 14475 / CIP 104303 / KCTC 5404 / NCIMB 10678 / 9a) TaxID=1128398 RepID=K0AZ36_GOTA9|nr:SdpI family protein [Gottschalkia acidurici]AFS77950.1 putative membrane protein [Gottschalkia acidurici 9a]